MSDPAGQARPHDPAGGTAGPAGVQDPARLRDMSRWLGNGGMELVGALGMAFEEYGAGPDGGWAEGRWTPTALACNPHGIVQAGVHAVILDAAMNFALNAGLAGRDRTRATLEMKAELMRPGHEGQTLTVRGWAVRTARLVGYAEATVRSGDLVSRATATFLLHRSD